MANFRDYVFHHATLKVVTILGFLGINYQLCKTVHHSDFAAHHNPFWIPHDFWRLFFWAHLIFQFFYILQLHSKDTAVAESSQKAGWSYFFYSLLMSLWAHFFMHHNFWVAFIFNILAVIVCAHMSWFTKTHLIRPHSRWWFIHFAASSLPTAFTHVSLFYTFWTAMGWHGKVSNIVADIAVWWFFFYAAFHLNRCGDWGHGLAFAFFAWGFYDGDHGNKIFHWFALAIAVLNTLYTFVVSYPDCPSHHVESGHHHGENAPLLSGEA